MATKKRPLVIEKAMADLKQHARNEIAKKQVFHFRLEPEHIKALYELAGKQRKPAGTMVREWVTEKIADESRVKKSISYKSIETQSASMVMEHSSDRLYDLEMRLKRLEKQLRVQKDKSIQKATSKKSKGK
jgi:hypothetical protein